MSRSYYIGAGHSNSDPGAVAGQESEAELMTELRNLVASEIRHAGYTAVTDGEGSLNQPLGKSIELAKTCTATRIELHVNSVESPVAKGVECLSLPDHKKKSQAIAKAIGDTLRINVRGDSGWKPDTAGQHSRLGFCREAEGIVVECFFLSNPAERQTYRMHKNDVAKAIASTLITEP